MGVPCTRVAWVCLVCLLLCKEEGFFPVMLVLRAVFNMVVRNASPRGPMCFRCLIFSLSGLCELLFFTLFYSLLDMSCGAFDVISL